jgi:hypothetical protein
MCRGLLARLFCLRRRYPNERRRTITPISRKERIVVFADFLPAIRVCGVA